LHPENQVPSETKCVFEWNDSNARMGRKNSYVSFICLTETRDKEERKENIQLNATDNSEQPKTVHNSTGENLQSRTTNPVIRFQALRAVQCVTTGDSNVEDSPVKSLRKWVDGCFHNTPVNVVNTSPASCETPPSTPPQKASTEASVIISGKDGPRKKGAERFSCHYSGIHFSVQGQCCNNRLSRGSFDFFKMTTQFLTAV